VLVWQIDHCSHRCPGAYDRLRAGRAYPHHAAAVLQPQPFRHLQGVVIPIPHVDVGLIQFLRHLAGRFAFQGEGAGGHALLQSAGILDAIHGHSGRLRQDIQ
jgi:hypothetical protein